MNCRWRSGSREYVYGQMSLDPKLNGGSGSQDDDSVRRATRRINCQELDIMIQPMVSSGEAGE